MMNEIWIGYLIVVFGVMAISLLVILGERFKERGNIQVDKPGEKLVKIDKIIFKVTSKYIDKKPLEKVVEQVIKQEVIK